MSTNDGFEDYNLGTRTTRFISAPVPPTDAHELHQLANGDFLLLSNPVTSNVDLSALGLTSSGAIVDCVIQEIRPNGALVWQWRASDHISVAESTHPNAFGAAYDLFHCNSIDEDAESENLLLSARHADSVYDISRLTGAIVWKLGGTTFNHDNARILTITDDPEGAFHAQHDARFQPNGDVSVYDNQSWNASLAARGVEYHIDTAAATARLVWSYQSADGKNSNATGTFRRLDGGTDNVVGWGFKRNALLTEVDASGKVLLNVTFPNGDLAYRVIKVPPAYLDHNLLRQTAGLQRFSFEPSTDQVVAVHGSSFVASEGVPVSAAVGSFSDPDRNGLGTDYLATVAWGDGSSSPATIAGPAGGPFSVTGTHAYGEEGTYEATVYLTDVADPENSSSAGLTVTVRDGWSATGTQIKAAEGTAFSGRAGVINESDPNAMAGDYAATINWGDGTISAGSVTGPQGGPFAVSGTHTYSEEGTYDIGVTAADVDTPGNSVTAASVAKSSDAPVAASCVTPTTSLTTFNSTTAKISDANPGATASDYTAQIDWGDWSITPGTVGSDGKVTGSHTYTSTGYYTITTSVNDDGGSTTSTSCTVLIYAFPTGGGSFVIGDNNGAIGSNVTFWGAQWWKLNPLSAGTAPANFKGFAETPVAPGCGTGWSNTGVTAPLGPLPDYMGVVVTSSVRRSGPVVSGNSVHLVIVRTNSGYQPSPGHPGSGTVVAQVC